jgi:hypothetical protein
MALAFRLFAVCSAVLFACAAADAQPPAAPEPHLALDGLVKEYKRLGLPLPPANAELVRVTLLRLPAYSSPDELAFRIPPTKPGEHPNYLIGADYETFVPGAEPVKPGAAALEGLRPEYVSNLLCLAVQCRVRGWNEFAELLYDRAHEAIQTPVRELRAKDSSVSMELQLAAEAYWHARVMSSDSDRV